MKNAKRGRGCLANTVALQQIRGIGVPPMSEAPSWPGRPCH